MVERFSVSVDKELIKKFDEKLDKDKFKNRSKAISHLIQEYLVDVKIQENSNVCGVILILYDHHKRMICDMVTDVQHHYSKEIISTQHIHLEGDRCLEIIAVKGIYKDVKNLYNDLRDIKGVVNAKIVITD